MLWPRSRRHSLTWKLSSSARHYQAFATSSITKCEAFSTRIVGIVLDICKKWFSISINRSWVFVDKSPRPCGSFPCFNHGCFQRKCQILDCHETTIIVYCRKWNHGQGVPCPKLAIKSLFLRLSWRFWKPRDYLQRSLRKVNDATAQRISRVLANSMYSTTWTRYFFFLCAVLPGLQSLRSWKPVMQTTMFPPMTRLRCSEGGNRAPQWNRELDQGSETRSWGHELPSPCVSYVQYLRERTQRLTAYFCYMRGPKVLLNKSNMHGLLCSSTPMPLKINCSSRLASCGCPSRLDAHCWHFSSSSRSWKTSD